MPARIMQRSHSSVIRHGRLVKISISVEDGAEVDTRSQRSLGRLVLDSLWPKHEEVLAIGSSPLTIVVRIPSSCDNFQPDLVDRSVLNDDLIITATYITESELEEFMLSSLRSSDSGHSWGFKALSKPENSFNSELFPAPASVSPREKTLSPTVLGSGNPTKPSLNQSDDQSLAPPRKISDPRNPKSGKPSNPPNKILHICNIDHDFQTGQEMANFLTVYGPLKELIYLTNQGKVFAHFQRLEDATRAMDDINRYEKPSRSFIRANYSHLAKLSFEFKAEHRNSRAFNHILREPSIPQRPPGSLQFLSRTVEVVMGGPEVQVPESAISQFSQALSARVLGYLGEKPEVRILSAQNAVSLTLSSELAAIKVLSKLHGVTVNGVSCSTRFQDAKVI